MFALVIFTEVLRRANSTSTGSSQNSLRVPIFPWVGRHFFLSQGSKNSPWENQCICLWLGLLTCLFSWTSEWIIIPLWFEDFRSPPECLILWVDHHSTKVISLHSECWEGLAFSIPFHVIPFHVTPFHAIPFHLCICLKCSKCWNSNVPCYYVCHVQ